MTITETVALLAYMACFDQRTVGQTDAHAWCAVAETEGWTFQLAKRAVLEHYGHHRERIMPADITNRINEIRQRLHERFEVPPHSAELADDGPAFVAWARRRKAEYLATALASWADTGRLPALLEIEE